MTSRQAKLPWQDLPKRQSLFTKRSATMTNLDNQKIVQHYAANTKIVVVQKCVLPEKTYYRTETAAQKGLNWAFEASAFGLPNEYAPPAHAKKKSPSSPKKPVPRTPSPVKKQTCAQKKDAPKGGGEHRLKSLWKRLFRRKK